MFLNDQLFDNIFIEFCEELKNSGMQECQKPLARDLKVNLLFLILEDILYRPQNRWKNLVPEKLKVKYDFITFRESTNLYTSIYETFCKYFPSPKVDDCIISCPSAIYPFALFCVYHQMKSKSSPTSKNGVVNAIINGNINRLKSTDDNQERLRMIKDLSDYLRFLYEIIDHKSVNVSINLHLFNQFYHYCDFLFLSRYEPYTLDDYNSNDLLLESRYMSIQESIPFEEEEDDDIDTNYFILTHLSTLSVKWRKFKTYYPKESQDKGIEQLLDFVNTSNALIHKFSSKMYDVYLDLDKEYAKEIYGKICNFNPYKKLLTSLVTYQEIESKGKNNIDIDYYYDYFREIHERPSRKSGLKND